MVQGVAIDIDHARDNVGSSKYRHGNEDGALQEEEVLCENIYPNQCQKTIYDF